MISVLSLDLCISRLGVKKNRLSVGSEVVGTKIRPLPLLVSEVLGTLFVLVQV